MQKGLLQFRKTEAPNGPADDSISSALLSRYVNSWLDDCKIRQHSPRTIQLRHDLFKKLFWFLEYHGHEVCGREEMRSFFAYLSGSYDTTEGRWKKGEARYKKPLRPATVATYYFHIQAFFNWLILEEYLSVSPMAKLGAPKIPDDQIQPFTMDQVSALIKAAQQTKYPRRDEAIVRFLLDTGVRVSELCTLKMINIDLIEGTAWVLGKGNKRRMVCFDRKTAKALRAYLRDEERTPDQCVFLSERGRNDGEPFLRGGILQLIERLGKKAGIESTRCSPHTFRHTFAVSFLRNHGNAFALKQILGHTSLHQTNKYVALAQADIKQQHRDCSPGNRV